MHFIRPKILGTLKIQKMMAGNWAVMNDFKNPPNKIIVPCRSIAHGEEIIEKIKAGKPGDKIFVG